MFHRELGLKSKILLFFFILECQKRKQGTARGDLCGSLPVLSLSPSSFPVYSNADFSLSQMCKAHNSQEGAQSHSVLGRETTRPCSPPLDGKGIRLIEHPLNTRRF